MKTKAVIAEKEAAAAGAKPRRRLKVLVHHLQKRGHAGGLVQVGSRLPPFRQARAVCELAAGVDGGGKACCVAVAFGGGISQGPAPSRCGTGKACLAEPLPSPSSFAVGCSLTPGE